MAGLGDEVVTRCASCGYALTARRYAVPHDCPICRAPLDPESAPPDDAHAQTTDDEEVTQVNSSTFASDATPAGASEREAALGVEPSPASTPSKPDEPAAHGRDARATTSPSLGSSSPSLGEVTNVTPPGAVTSPLGSVTLPMYESDARGPGEVPTGGPRKTVSYAPLDAGELWSEFGGREPARAEPTPSVEPPTRADAKTHSEAKTPAAPPPLSTPTSPSTPSPSPSSSSSSTPSLPPSSSTPSSFPQSSPLGLSGAPSAPQPRHAQAATHASPQPFTPPPAPAQVQRIQAQQLRGAFEAGVAPKVLSRYRDGYRVARATVALGTFVKVLGGLLGLLLGFGAFAAAGSLGQGTRGGLVGLVLGLFLGGGTFAFFFVLGVILSSFGQLKKAALDAAVNSSPFLTNEERAEAMSLR